MALTDKAMTIVVFTLFLNAVPGLLMGMGVADDMGIDPNVGGGENVTEANDAIRGDPNDDTENGIQPSGGFGETLFQLYTSVGGTLQTVLALLIGGEVMLINAGVPEHLVFFFFAPKWIILGAALIYVLIGRRL